MPNFKTHISTGIFIFPFFFLLFNSIYSHLFYPIYYVSHEIFISFLLFVLGSDFPDVDHNSSFINNLFRLFLIFGSVFYLFEYDYLYKKYLRPYFNNNIYNFFIILVGTLIGIILGKIFNKLTKHRRMWHSIITGIVLSLFIYLLNFKYRLPIKIFYSLSFMSGFSIHIILDKTFSSKK